MLLGAIFAAGHGGHRGMMMRMHGEGCAMHGGGFGPGMQYGNCACDSGPPPGEPPAPGTPPNVAPAPPR